MSSDTPADVGARYREMVMALAPEDRLAMCARMFADARTLVIAGLADEANPEGHSLRARIFLRMYGHDFDPVERRRIVEELDRREQGHA